MNQSGRGSRMRPIGLLLLGLLPLVAACDGNNLFEGGSGGFGTGGPDQSPPSVEVQSPAPASTVPTQDSVLVQVRVRDNSGVARVELSGVAFRGDPAFGSDTTVERFQPKTVELARAPKDTIVQRFLKGVGTETERVSIIVRATDLDENAAADTVEVLVGGPRIEVRSPSQGQQVQAGRDLGIRLVANDADGIVRIQLDYSGVTSGQIVQAFTPALDSIVVDTFIPLPAGATGSLELRAAALNTQDIGGRSSPRLVQVVTAAQADAVSPFVSIEVTGRSRMELTDTIKVTVTARDNDGGTGISRIGITPVAINTARTDTLTLQPKSSVTFANPRTGTIVREFKFTPAFTVDSLALPDTVFFLIHAFAVDAAGNCAAAVAKTEQRLSCGQFSAAGQVDTVGAGNVGQRLDVVAVTGRTVLLPDGGLIADAAVDGPRRRLYLSNFSFNKVDLLDLSTMEFLRPGVLVGSQPWGLFMNSLGDTLIVANSGGTNISFVSLAGTPAEDPVRRLRTPNVSLFEIRIGTDAVGRVRYTGRVFDFSDRPQFIAQDATGKLLYSTVPTGAAPDGTVRVADTDPDPSSDTDIPEVRLLFTDDAVRPSETSVAIAHVDDVVLVHTDNGDRVVILDHVPGFPDQVISTPVLEIGDAIANIVGQGSDIYARTGTWITSQIGLSDTTFVAASGDRSRVVFGDGGTAPFASIWMWDAGTETISDRIEVVDLINNAAERVRGVGLNANGTLGVARGQQAAYFFTPNLRLQGQFSTGLGEGGAGAVMHPNHDTEQVSNANTVSFVGTSRQTIKAVDTFHFFQLGELHIRDNVVGPLRASTPLAGDNAGRTCPGDTNCVVLKLYGVSAAGGVTVLNVRARNLLP